MQEEFELDILDQSCKSLNQVLVNQLNLAKEAVNFHNEPMDKLHNQKETRTLISLIWNLLRLGFRIVHLKRMLWSLI